MAVVLKKKRKMTPKVVREWMGDFDALGYVTLVHDLRLEEFERLLKGLGLKFNVCEIRMNSTLLGVMITTPQYYEEKKMGADPGVTLVRSVA